LISRKVIAKGNKIEQEWYREKLPKDDVAG